MWESPSHEKGGTIGGKVHGMTQSGRLEGFAEGFGPEGSVMLCAAGRFYKVFSLFSNGKLWQREDQGFNPYWGKSPLTKPSLIHTIPKWESLPCLVAILAVAFV